jgi:magnesium chelatase family protein
MIQRYQNRVSGPLMDRIDIHIEVQRVPFEKLAGLEAGEASATIRQRVDAARHRQAERFAGWQKAEVLVNGDMGPAEVQHFCRIEEPDKELLRTAVQQLHLSARAYHRVLKLSRTIADLDGSARINVQHLAEALQYRPRETM